MSQYSVSSSADPSFQSPRTIHQRVETYDNEDGDDGPTLKVQNIPSKNPRSKENVTETTKSAKDESNGASVYPSSFAEREALRVAMLRVNLADLTSACQRLGRSHVVDKKVVYEKSIECEGQLEDIMRYLLQEDADFPEDRKYSETIGTTGLITRDILPLLHTYPDNINLCMMLLKVLYMVTRQPLKHWTCYNKIIEAQQKIKEGFLKIDVLPILAHKVAEVLVKEGSFRTKDDNEYIELLLGIISNLLSVPNKIDTALSANPIYTFLQEEFISKCHKDLIFDVLMVICQRIDDPENSEFANLVLEIFSQILVVAPEEVARYDPRQGKSSSKSGQDGAMAKALQQDQEKLRSMSNVATTRHSRFGGTFVTTSLVGSSIIRNAQITQIKDKSASTAVERRKQTASAPEEIKSLQTKETWRCSPTAIRSIQAIGTQFIKDGLFTALVRVIRSNIEYSGGVEPKSIRQLCTVTGWCLSFQRHMFIAKRQKSTEKTSTNPAYEFQDVSEAVSSEFLQFINRGIAESSAEKRWEDLVTYCYTLKEQLSTLHYINQYGLDSDHKFFMANMRGFFYDIDAVEMFPTLLKQYNPKLQPKQLAEMVVEISYNIIRLMEAYEKSQSIVVCRKIRRTILVETSMQAGNQDVQEENANQNLDTNNEGESVSKEKELEENPQERSKILEPIKPVQTPDESVKNDASKQSNSDANDEESQSDDDSSASNSNRKITHEESIDAFYNTKYYIAKFAHPFTIDNMLYLISRFNDAPGRLVQCCMKIFHHITIGLGLYKLFYMLSYFRLFTLLLNDPLSKSKEELVNFRDFAKFIFSKFLEDAKLQPSLYVEILFYRSARSCIDESDSDSENSTQKKERKRKWSAEDEEYLRDLHDQYRDDPNGLSIVCEKMPHKTESQIKNRVRKLGLVRLRKPRASKGEGNRDGIENDIESASGGSESESSSGYDSSESSDQSFSPDKKETPDKIENDQGKDSIKSKTATDGKEKKRDKRKKSNKAKRKDFLEGTTNENDSTSMRQEQDTLQMDDMDDSEFPEDDRISRAWTLVSAIKGMSNGAEFITFLGSQIDSAVKYREDFISGKVDDIPDLLICPDSIAQLDACMSIESQELLGKVLGYEIPQDQSTSFYSIRSKKSMVDLLKDKYLLERCKVHMSLESAAPSSRLTRKDTDTNETDNDTLDLEDEETEKPPNIPAASNSVEDEMSQVKKRRVISVVESDDEEI